MGQDLFMCYRAATDRNSACVNLCPNHGSRTKLMPETQSMFMLDREPQKCRIVVLKACFKTKGTVCQGCRQRFDPS